MHGLLPRAGVQPVVCEAWSPGQGRLLRCNARKPRSNRIALLVSAQNESTEPQTQAGSSVLTTRLSATPTQQRYALPTARLTANVRRHPKMPAGMTPRPQSRVLGVLMIVGGLAAVLLALLMVLPVAVNLPDSAFGAVLAVGFAAGGITLMYRGSRRLRSQTSEV